MAEKPPPKNVHKLIAAQKKPKPKRSADVTLPKRFKSAKKPKPKPPPKNVLGLIADALKRKGQ